MVEYEAIGQALLQGKKIEQITLNGREFKFNYTIDEFITIALKAGWPEEEATKYAIEFERRKSHWVCPDCRTPIESPEFTNNTWLGTCTKCKKEKEAYGFSVQSRFISDFQSDYCLNSGGFGSGKSIALYIKLVLFLKCFPNNRVLVGRKTLSDIDRAVLPELFDLMPKKWYHHRVKDGLINMDNGSQIVLFGLDSMQSGSIADIKKAQQKLKSLNLGAYFIDQLEEVEMPVIEVLNSRLRRNEVPFRQGNSDCNPANFWAYHMFKLKKKIVDDQWVPDENSTASLYESSMLQNPHLPWDYIRRQLNMDEAYVKRFVEGQWTTDILVKGTVFAKEHIKHLETFVRPPIETKEGCEIFEAPSVGEIYQMGVDPSEGVVDPSSISVVSGNGRKVAKFNGFATIPELADKIKMLYYMYNKPLIVPEVNKSSILEHIKDLRVYKRRQHDYREKKETEKLGFMTTWSSKEALITHFQQLLRDGVPKIYDMKTIEEMKSFTWSNEASMQGASASRGFHDDDVMSTLLAFWDLTPKRVQEIKIARSQPTRKKRFQYS